MQKTGVREGEDNVKRGCQEEGTVGGTIKEGTLKSTAEKQK